MPRYCLALDLKNDPRLMEEYKAHHRAVWPEIQAAIRASGVVGMEIYATGTRMFMIMEVVEGFSFERMAALDAANPQVQAWEALMWRYQAALPHADAGEKWVRMERIFSLE